MAAAFIRFALLFAGAGAGGPSGPALTYQGQELTYQGQTLTYGS